MSRLQSLAQALSLRIPAYHIAVDDLLQLTGIRAKNDVAKSPATCRYPSAQRCDKHALPDRLPVSHCQHTAHGSLSVKGALDSV